jgi:hypothetical protein
LNLFNKYKLEQEKEFKSILEEQAREFKLQLKEQEELIKQLKNNTSITNNNNTINNINNGTINNTINIVNHGKEDISKLTKEEIKDILNAGYNCVVKCIEYIHFNERLPEYQNIIYTDKKASNCYIIEDKKWIVVSTESTIDELIDKHIDNVTEMKDDNPELFESPIKKKYLDEFIDDRNKYESYETEDRYPENWNDKMKKDQQKKSKKMLNKNRNEVKNKLLNKSKELKNNKKLNLKNK